MTEAQPVDSGSGRRIAIVHAGGLAPGMNSAVKAAVRLGLHRGHTMLGVQGGFPGLADGRISPLSWGEVVGWEAAGGADLGTRRDMPSDADLDRIAEQIHHHRLDALMVIGGINAYLGVYDLWQARKRHEALRLPVVLLPASIDNNLPAVAMSIGADTALNMDVTLMDRLKQSAIASQRCFVVETMGRHCGFLALTSGVAAGAERVYLDEVPFGITDLERDVAEMRASFAAGRRFYLAVRNEEAHPYYTTDFLRRLFTAEGEDFDVRQAVLGHVQQGGVPSPFDRINAGRLAARGLDEIDRQLAAGDGMAVFAAEQGFRPAGDMDELIDRHKRRPHQQWWLQLLPVMEKLSTRPVPDAIQEDR